MVLRASFIMAACVLACSCKMPYSNFNYTYYNPNNGSVVQINRAPTCVNIRPQNSLDIAYLTGVWYGKEIIMHTQDVPGVYRYNSCVIILLTDITQQIREKKLEQELNQNGEVRNSNYVEHHLMLLKKYVETPQSRYLKLVWSENQENIEYILFYENGTPGFWVNRGEQRGTMITHNNYTQFTGTVQVLKAVDNHLVLTFCGNDIRKTIYSIVLTRKLEKFSKEDLFRIHYLIERCDLNTRSIRRICVESASALIQFNILLLLGSLLVMTTEYVV